MGKPLFLEHFYSWSFNRIINDVNVMQSKTPIDTHDWLSLIRYRQNDYTELHMV